MQYNNNSIARKETVSLQHKC